MKGSKSGTASGVGKGKATTEKKGKWSPLLTRIGMNFDTKTMKLYNQEEVGEYLAKYGVC